MAQLGDLDDYGHSVWLWLGVGGADLRSLRWAELISHAQAGDFAPLADALHAADPAKVPRDVLAFAADAMTGKLPKRKPGKKMTMERRQAAELLYLSLRAEGRGAVFAVDEVARHFDVSRSAAYELIDRVRWAGDRIAEGE